MVGKNRKKIEYEGENASTMPDLFLKQVKITGFRSLWHMLQSHLCAGFRRKIKLIPAKSHRFLPFRERERSGVMMTCCLEGFFFSNYKNRSSPPPYKSEPASVVFENLRVRKMVEHRRFELLTCCVRCNRSTN